LKYDLRPRLIRRHPQGKGAPISARYEVHGTTAVITLDNPPVNGLGLATRTAIANGVDRALADPKVTAIVLTGGGKLFSGGADIREFGSPKATTEPTLHSVIRAVEDSSKPVIAAINGTCAGGGQYDRLREPGAHD